MTTDVATRANDIPQSGSGPNITLCAVLPGAMTISINGHGYTYLVDGAHIPAIVSHMRRNAPGAMKKLKKLAIEVIKEG